MRRPVVTCTVAGKTNQPATMSAEKRKGQPDARWREFLLEASKLLAADHKGMKVTANQDGWVVMLAFEIVRHGDGEAFLKAVHRGRSTMRQNIRYQLLREVEKQMGDAVPRRRPDANTPDSVALKKTVRLELEEFSKP